MLVPARVRRVYSTHGADAPEVKGRRVLRRRGGPGARRGRFTIDSTT